MKTLIIILLLPLSLLSLSASPTMPTLKERTELLEAEVYNLVLTEEFHHRLDVSKSLGIKTFVMKLSYNQVVRINIDRNGIFLITPRTSLSDIKIRLDNIKLLELKKLSK